MHQDFFWGQFGILQDSFEQIISFNNVSAYFLDFVHAYGKKIDKDKKCLNEHYQAIFADLNSKKFSYFSNFIDYKSC